MRTSSFIAALLVSCTSASAGEIYRWVDEHGKVHVSDVVPEKYRASARRLDSSRFEVSPEDRAAAEQRAAADRARARPAAPAASSPAPRPATAQSPAPAPSADSDCETAHRLYWESVDCFAPFVNANGSVRAEAFQHCTPVPDPAARCRRPQR